MLLWRWYGAGGRECDCRGSRRDDRVKLAPRWQLVEWYGDDETFDDFLWDGDDQTAGVSRKAWQDSNLSGI